MKKLIALLMCLSLCLGAVAIAETTDPAATTATQLQDSDVVVTVNDQAVTWADLQTIYDSLVNTYGTSYDLTDSTNVDLFRSVAMENKITETLIAQKAVELGLELTAEEIAEAEATADSDWANAIQSYITQTYPDLNDESTQEDKDAANAEAVKYYNDLGFSPESLHESYKENASYNKVVNSIIQDVTVTDEEVEQLYQELVAADKELYQNDISAYVEYNSYVDQMAMYAMYYGNGNNMDYAWYRPAGFRAVKHILLPVDETLMTDYQDLQARLEEQMTDEAEGADVAEPTAEPAADAEATEPAAPVTQADVDNAKAAILASKADIIDEINQKIAEGADFDELIATYGVNADGTASDPGMTSEPYMTNGYEVAQSSTNYVPEFVEAAFSIDSVGDVSAPYLSSFGIHIVKYIGDVAEGPIAMTDAQREAKRISLLQSKQNELYAATMEQWIAESTIVYGDLIPTIAEIEAAQAEAAAQAAEAQATEAQAAPVEAAPAEDATPAEGTEPAAE